MRALFLKCRNHLEAGGMGGLLFGSEKTVLVEEKAGGLVSSTRFRALLRG